MTEQDKAQKLAEWLAAPAGAAPPEGLDPEVLAAVVALRPERAPAPRVSFDEIVSTVQSGPFVAANNNVGMPAPVSRRRGWFMVFVSSGAFAAAAVGLIFVPIAYSVLSSRMSSMEQVAPAADEALAPAPAAPSPEGGGVPEMQAQAPAVPLADTPARAVDDAAAPAGGAALPAADKEVANREERKAEDQAPPAEPGAVAPIAEAASSGDADRPTDLLEALGYTEAAPAPAPPPAKPAAAPAQEAARAPTTSMTTGASTSTPPPSANAGKGATKSKASVAEDEADLGRADDEKQQSSRLKKDASDGVWAARDAAIPTDYNSSWYTKYPDVAAVYARGDFSTLLEDSRSDVAMDAAWRAATAWRAGGDSGRALSTVQAALRKSKANTVFRSNLLLLQGDLYTESDRFSSATEAWNEAARLNRAR